MRKIQFNDRYSLTNAVLQGRKTMTRRLVPIKEAKRLESFFDGDDWDYAKQTCIDDSATYKIGEVVAVAQSYKDLGYTEEWIEQHITPNPNAIWNDPFGKKYPGWNNKMFAKSEFMLHQIQITGAHIERLQDINYDDCFKEGIVEHMDSRGYCYYYVKGMPGWFHSPHEAFATLIDKVSGKGTWERNPWTFVYSFELIK